MSLPDLKRARRVTTEALMEHLAAEHLAVEDFEARLARAEAATSPAELRAVLSGLPGRSADLPPEGSGGADWLHQRPPGARPDEPSRAAGGAVGRLWARVLRSLGANGPEGT
ncbi:MAG TPA: hypothetical protein VGA70_08660 [Longimicrobiales bacterium]|jgi:hypothetical protein